MPVALIIVGAYTSIVSGFAFESLAFSQEEDLHTLTPHALLFLTRISST